MDRYNSEIISYTISEKPTDYAIMSTLKEAIAFITVRSGLGIQNEILWLKHHVFQSMFPKTTTLPRRYL